MKATVCILYSLLFEQGDKMWYPYLLHDPAFHWDSTLGRFVLCQHYWGPSLYYVSIFLNFFDPPTVSINTILDISRKGHFPIQPYWRNLGMVPCMYVGSGSMYHNGIKLFLKDYLMHQHFHNIFTCFFSFMQYKYWIGIFHEKIVITQK